MNYLFLIYLFFFQDAGSIIVHNAWIRPAAESFNTAFYCTIVNKGDQADTLYRITSNISDDIQLHETYMKDDLIGMRPVTNIVIPPHDSTQLKPGSFHIMIMNLKEKADENDLKKLILFFRKSGKIEVKADVSSQH